MTHAMNQRLQMASDRLAATASPGPYGSPSERFNNNPPIAMPLGAQAQHGQAVRQQDMVHRQGGGPDVRQEGSLLAHEMGQPSDTPRLADGGGAGHHYGDVFNETLCCLRFLWSLHPSALKVDSSYTASIKRPDRARSQKSKPLGLIVRPRRVTRARGDKKQKAQKPPSRIRPMPPGPAAFAPFDHVAQRRDRRALREIARGGDIMDDVQGAGNAALHVVH